MKIGFEFDLFSVLLLKIYTDRTDIENFHELHFSYYSVY